MNEAATRFIAAFGRKGVSGPWQHSTLLTESSLLGSAVSLRSTKAGKVVVSDLWVSESVRGSGKGGLLLHLLCHGADTYGVTLRLRPCAFNRTERSPTTRQLRTWYARHGFECKGATYMERKPVSSRANNKG